MASWNNGSPVKLPPVSSMSGCIVTRPGYNAKYVGKPDMRALARKAIDAKNAKK